ncbi:pirin family protein [Stakelama tenebrarum]|uniref:Pirin family protein n=1 Tax=Stakelama tenebrarum TaxID=2711215 RepID=A0A6G6Y0X4_9SPHN|nr:pirin family protein [Sphingosinithalassobacter tenebrarum]QIG78481.1 pirin family protein [Sphingosinithalassobacter tenebrarum]
MSERHITALHGAYRDDIGDLVTRRPVPGPQIDRIGAFLFLNHHGPQTYPPGNGGLPFGPHPHRGFETVTFILDGELAHADSAGHESVIRAGGIQWMTAGKGVVHAELSPESFKAEGGPMEILQLWVNLPARLKMTEPRYIGAQADAIPVVAGEGATVHLVSGSYGGVKGPVDSLTGVFMSWATIEARGSATFDGLRGRDVFLYAVRGDVSVAGTALPEHHLAELGDGDSVTISADAPAVILFGHADPIDEPVVAHGPFVMNSAEEIRQAYSDYRAGRFGNARMVEA